MIAATVVLATANHAPWWGCFVFMAAVVVLVGASGFAAYLSEGRRD